MTQEQARRFITAAKVSITKRQGMSENYIAVDGATYVNPQTMQIKTAFTSAGFDDKIKKILVEVKKHEQSRK